MTKNGKTNAGKAALTGAAIGAAAGAAAVLLSKKENREKVKKAANDARIKAEKMQAQVEKRFNKEKDKTMEAAKRLEDATKKVEEAKKEME